MIHRILLLFLVFCACGTPGMLRAEDDFPAALAAFEARDYPRCLQHLQNLHDAGRHAPESWLLAGNAHAMAGDTARAMLAYRRALVLDPSLTEAGQNLGVLAAQAGTTEASAPPVGLAWVAGLPRPLLLLTLSLGIWLGLLGGYGVFFAKSAVWPAASLGALVAGTALTLGGGSLAIAQYRATSPGPSGTPKIWRADAQLMTTSTLRAAPARRAEPILADLPAGTPIRIVQQSGWTYAEVPRGAGAPPARGWIEPTAWQSIGPFGPGLP